MLGRNGRRSTGLSSAGHDGVRQDSVATNGTLNPIVVVPSVLEANTLPPCMFATALTIARPSPYPCSAP